MKKGFTLLEILLVIAAIGILAAIVIVAINPTRQIGQTRNTVRRSDGNTVVKAFDQYLVDNGSYPSGLTDSYQEICAQDASDCTGLLDVQTALVPQYIAAIPQNPGFTSPNSGYEVAINENNGKISFNALGAELDQEIVINPLGEIEITEWANAVGSTGTLEFADDVAVDNQGNVFVAGSFQSSVDFGGTAGVLSSSGGTDGFLVKYDSTGVAQWGKRVGGSSSDYARTVTVDPSGNVYFAGSFFGSATMTDAGSIGGGGNFDAFVAKFDTDGVLQWNRTIGGSSTDYANEMYADGSYVYLTGKLSGANVDFGNGVSQSAFLNGQDMFLAQFDHDGLAQWTTIQGANSANDEGFAVVGDGNGDVYVASQLFGSINLGSAGSFTTNDRDVFLSKYDATGTILWAAQIGGASFETPADIDVDSTNAVVITGSYTSNIDFDTLGTFGSAGSNDFFTAKYDSVGNPVWADVSGNNNVQAGSGLAIDSEDSIYVTGPFSGIMQFPPLADLVGVSGWDAYVVKYDSAGVPQWTLQRESGSGFDEGGVNIFVDRSDNLYVVGYFEGTIDFGSAGSFASNGGRDIFVWARPAE